MQRKLIKQGQNTLTITLPAKWIKKNNLVNGDFVEISSENNSLNISSNKKEKPIKSISLTLDSEVESDIRTKITNAYRSGFDSININYNSKTQFKTIEEVISKNLLGFEIMPSSKNKCIIENIAEPSTSKYEIIFQKILHMITQLFELTRNNLEQNSFENIEEIEKITRDIQKYDNFCRRAMSKKIVHEDKSMQYWQFFSEITHGTRKIFFLNRDCYEKNIKITKNMIELFNDTSNYFETLKKCYLSKNKEFLSKLHKEEKIIIYQKGYEKIEKHKGKSLIYFYHIFDIVRLYYLSTSPLYIILEN